MNAILKPICRPWRTNEVALLLAKYAIHGAKACSRDLNRTTVAVYRQANKLGLRHTSLWTEAEDEIIRAHYAQGTTVCAVMMPQRTYAAIRQRAQRLGVRA